MNSNQSLSQGRPDASIAQIIHAHNEAGKRLASIGVSLSKHKEDTLGSLCQQQKWREWEVPGWVKNSNRHFKQFLIESGDLLPAVQKELRAKK